MPAVLSILEVSIHKKLDLITNVIILLFRWSSTTLDSWPVFKPISDPSKAFFSFISSTSFTCFLTTIQPSSYRKVCLKKLWYWCSARRIPQWFQLEAIFCLTQFNRLLITNKFWAFFTTSCRFQTKCFRSCSRWFLLNYNTWMVLCWQIIWFRCTVTSISTYWTTFSRSCIHLQWESIENTKSMVLWEYFFVYFRESLKKWLIRYQKF